MIIVAILFLGIILDEGRDVEYIDEDTTWDYWCYWRGVIITEKQRKYGKGFRENGVNRDYTTREAV